jgi:predicted RNA-binding Zn-ribbon protein involved in translation (DUF1610 family)
MIGSTPHSNHPDGDELPSPCIGEGIQLALRKKRWFVNCPSCGGQFAIGDDERGVER